MPGARFVLGGTIGLAVAAGTLLGGCRHHSDLAALVNPFIGTATFDGAPDNRYNAGNVFPGAAFPFGMVQFSPDTTTLAGGYRHTDTKIGGFSLTHFSGRGVPCWQDVAILPTLGPVDRSSRSPSARWAELASPFQHARERASPGRYQVILDADGIGVELTATARTGMARFTFPAGAPPTILINAGASAQGTTGTGTEVRIAAPDRVIGAVESGGCGGEFRYRVFFVAEFDRPFRASGTWIGDALAPGGAHAAGADTGAYLTFAPGPAALQARIGLSFVSAEGAGRNLEAENPGWDFEKIAATAAAAWNERLRAIEVDGGTAHERTVFYTALYHTMLHPNLFSDADGSYVGFDERVHRAPAGGAQYENFATWDTYRSEMPLLSILAPREAGDMMASLVRMAQEDPGGGLPRWEQAAGNSAGMIGDSPDVVLASAYAFGVRGFDAEAALRAMERGASVPGTTSGGHHVREGLAAYLARGYVPFGESRAGNIAASATLEYAADDFAIAALAGALGDQAARDRYRARAGNWRNLWTPAGGGLLAPRREDGTFVDGVGPSSGVGFAEGSAEQYVWAVPFDARALFAAMGGNARAVARLDAFFERLNDGMDSAHAFFGNEPGEGAPWLYAFAGAPYRTQALVRRILRELYLDAPGGLPGNDDAGALSSWAVFAAIGLYPAIPGVGGFVVGSPLFPRIAVRLAGGRVLRIVAPGAATDVPYVTALLLDGRAHDRAWLGCDEVAAGAELRFRLSRLPDPAWAAGPTDGPP